MSLKALENDEPNDSPFGNYEEEAIASLILDHPEFFTHIAKFITYKLFKRPEVQYIIANIVEYHDKYNEFPTRGILKDTIAKQLTVDDEYVDDILSIVDRPSNPREIPAIKDRLLEWAKTQAYSLLWDKETIDRYKQGDYDYIEQVVNEAKLIQDVSSTGLWFFDELESLFYRDEKERFTTGIYELDQLLDEGGPSRGDEVVWMAPTGVGKCHTLESKMIEENLSGIFEIELDNGKTLKLAGFREVQTARGPVKVCDLTEEDDIVEIPNIRDGGDISV